MLPQNCPKPVSACRLAFVWLITATASAFALFIAFNAACFLFRASQWLWRTLWNTPW